MELLSATKPSSALRPRLEQPKTLRSRPLHARCLASPLPDHFFAAYADASVFSIPFQTPKSVSSRSNLLRNRLTRMPDLRPNSTATSCSNLLQEHASTRRSDRSAVIPNRDLLVRNFLKLQLQLSVMSAVSFPLPSLASDAEQVSDKINVEVILESVDSFFNRYPFFVAGVTFVWLVLVPLAREYLKKYKHISAIDAFRKLKDDPNCQLLDIRKEQSRAFLDSPNLKSLSKIAVQTEFSEGREEAFVKNVLKNLRDPSNTVVCVLDNFDDDSLKVAELLVKNGFKEAYAIKGGVRGKEGWQAIQETLLPPSVHVYPRKKTIWGEGGISGERGSNGYESNDQVKTSRERPQVGENGQVKGQGEASERGQSSPRSSSPYPNYPDLKPPSSPTPSKP